MGLVVDAVGLVVDASPPRRAAPKPRISNAPSADALLELFAQHGAQMDAMHHGNLWNKLGRHVRQQHASRKLPPARADPLLSATLAHAPNCGAQPIANIAGGVAHVGVPASAATPLFEALAARAKAISAKLEPRHAANLAWAYASVGVSSSPMVDDFDGCSPTRRRVQRAGARDGDGGARPAARREAVAQEAAADRTRSRAGAPRGVAERPFDLDELCGAYARLGLMAGARLTAAAAAAGAAALRGNGRRRRCAASPICCGRWRGSRRRTARQGRAATQRDVWRLPRRRSGSSPRARPDNARDCAVRRGALSTSAH